MPLSDIIRDDTMNAPTSTQRGLSAVPIKQAPSQGLASVMTSDEPVSQELSLSDGDFIIPADVVSKLGAGATDEGFRLLQSMEADIMQGAPQENGAIQGQGSGIADVVPARVDGEIPARVSNGEYHIKNAVVKQLGQGDNARGVALLETLLSDVRKQDVEENMPKV